MQLEGGSEDDSENENQFNKNTIKDETRQEEQLRLKHEFKKAANF